MKPSKLACDPNLALAAVIDELAPAERTISALADALAADQVNRDGSRGPDHRTRVQAALALLQYRVGRPVERSEVISVTVEKDHAADLTERLKSSPALRASLQRLLNAAAERGAVDI